MRLNFSFVYLSSGKKLLLLGYFCVGFFWVFMFSSYFGDITLLQVVIHVKSSESTSKRLSNRVCLASISITAASFFASCSASALAVF